MNRVLELLVAAVVLVLVAVPGWAGPPNPTASDVQGNTAGGTSALSNVTVNGFQNTAFGRGALQLTTTGGNNTAVGESALQLNTGGRGNTAAGFAAMELNTIGEDNTAIGSAALLSNTTGSDNTAVGTEALFRNVNGTLNTATGRSALFSNSAGASNTATGVEALYANTTGDANTAGGGHALHENTTGSFNVASGFSALYFNEDGDGNTANGAYALRLNVSGNYNTAAGLLALAANGAGSRNTALGYQALLTSQGGRNTAVGYLAGSALQTGSQNIYLAHPGAANESQTMRLGQGQTRTFVAGVAGAAVSGAPVLITPGGRLGVQVSSVRYKEDVAPLGDASEALDRLRPVSFVYRDDEQRTRQYGLIAEEVDAVYPELVTRTETGEVQAVRYHELIPLLLNALQRQQREVAELRAIVTQMRERAARNQEAALD